MYRKKKYYHSSNFKPYFKNTPTDIVEQNIITIFNTRYFNINDSELFTLLTKDKLILEEEKLKSNDGFFNLGPVNEVPFKYFNLMREEEEYSIQPVSSVALPQTKKQSKENADQDELIKGNLSYLSQHVKNKHKKNITLDEKIEIIEREQYLNNYSDKDQLNIIVKINQK